MVDVNHDPQPNHVSKLQFDSIKITNHILLEPSVNSYELSSSFPIMKGSI